jgi:ATP synthase protein I
MNTTDPKGTQEEDPNQVRRPQNWGLLIDLGFRLGLSVVIGVVGGVLIDNWLGTRPIFTLLGVVVGVGAAMYSIWDVARAEMNRR